MWAAAAAATRLQTPSLTPYYRCQRGCFKVYYYYYFIIITIILLFLFCLFLYKSSGPQQFLTRELTPVTADTA